MTHAEPRLDVTLPVADGGAAAAGRSQAAIPLHAGQRGQACPHATDAGAASAVHPPTASRTRSTVTLAGRTGAAHAGRPAPTSRLTRGRLAAVAGAAAAVVVAAVAWQAATGPGVTGVVPTQTPAGYRATPAPPAAAAAGYAWYTVPGLGTAERLRQFAAHLGGAETDASTGPYTCRHVQRWGRAGTVMHRTDTTVCRNDTDGSSVETTRTLPDRPGLLPLPDGSDRPQFATAPLTIERHLPGDLRPLVAEPVPTDPDELTDAVLMHHREALADAGPGWLVRQLMRLYQEQYLDRAHRAGALTALAAVQGLAFAGPRTDLAGRTGVAFTLAAPDSRYTIVFDPVTGQLRAFTEVVPDTRATTAVRPGIWGYDLLLDIRRRPLPPNPGAPPGPDTTG